VNDQTYQIIGAALEVHSEIEWAQVLNYLKASGHQRGLLSVGALFGPTMVRKETERKNLRNLCNLRIFPDA
jgi:hypothetical protein